MVEWGLILLWKEGLEVTTLSVNEGHIDSIIYNTFGNKWYLTGFYGHPNKNQRIFS